MNIQPRLKSVLLVLMAVLTVVLVAGYYIRSGAQHERLLHDSQTIEEMLSEREHSHQ